MITCVPGCGLSIQDNYPHLKGALPSEVLFLLESKVTRGKKRLRTMKPLPLVGLNVTDEMFADMLGFYPIFSHFLGQSEVLSVFLAKVTSKCLFLD